MFFINRHRNRIKLLHLEPGGLVLYAKMLERGTFGKLADNSTRRQRLDILRHEAGEI